MMYMVVIVSGLVLTYALTLASFAWEDLLVGAVLGSLLVMCYRRQVLPTPLPSTGYVLRVAINMPRMVALILGDMFRGTWQVASIVVGLRPLAHPGIIRIPIADHGPGGVAMIGFIVTVSPGSFMLGIDWDEGVMLVHYIDASDPDKLRRDVERYYPIWQEKRTPARKDGGM